MADRKAAKKPATSTRGTASTSLSADEKAAMREYSKELKAAAAGRLDESALLEKIAEMPGPDRALAKRLHALMKATAPALASKTWYGMPAYYKDGKVVVFFQSADKFKARYATLGFNDTAKLDEGVMWPTSFALKEWTPAVETRIAALVKKALS